MVVPLYNGSPTIRRCLDSVLRQTWADFEVVVVDDGSTDGGGAVACQTGDARVRVAGQPNRGVAAARNRGIAEARAPLIAFLDADDEWEPGFLAAVVELAELYPLAGAYVTGMRSLLDGVPFLEVTLAPPGAETGTVDNYLATTDEGEVVSSSNTAVPKRVLDQVGGFPEGEWQGEDLDLWARIGVRYPIACTRRVLALRHADQGQRYISRAGWNAPFPPPVRTLRAMMAAGNVPPAKQSEVAGYIDSKILEWVYVLLEVGNRAKARQVLREERLSGRRARLEALLLRTALTALPARAVLALRRKPYGLLLRLRRLFAGPQRVVTGRYVTRRWLPPA